MVKLSIKKVKRLTIWDGLSIFEALSVQHQYYLAISSSNKVRILQFYLAICVRIKL